MRWLILVLLASLVGCAGGGPRYSSPNDCPPRLRIYYPDFKPCAPVDAPVPKEQQSDEEEPAEPDLEGRSAKG